MTTPNWSFLQLYYVTKQVFTGDSSNCLLSQVCSKVKSDVAEKLIAEWYKKEAKWAKVREAYSSDEEFLKAWSEYLLPYRTARKALELADV